MINEIDKEQTLTEIEIIGLNHRYDLANGHASQELRGNQSNIISELPIVWEHAAQLTSREAELLYLDSFQQLANTPSLKTHPFFKICPTASCSIDIVAAWLADNHLKTALIEPTFDNLYLLLKRRGVSLCSLPEDTLDGGEYMKLFVDVDAIFLVNPNNPTGKCLSEKMFRELIEWCVNSNKLLILDQSFRFFIPQAFDIYDILIDSNIRFISIEDTGKVWPTQEIKASLLISSENIFKSIDKIYDEIFLCHSNFSLLLLSKFLLDAHKHGLEKTVWDQIAYRRQLFRNALIGDIFEINESSKYSTLSVEWVKINNYFNDDLAAAAYFYSHDLIILPGRKFYWNHTGSSSKTCYLRFALLKPEMQFIQSIEIIRSKLTYLQSHEHACI